MQKISYENKFDLHENENVGGSKHVFIYRGYYMPARGYEFYLRVVNSISHSFAALTREISS